MRWDFSSYNKLIKPGTSVSPLLTGEHQWGSKMVISPCLFSELKTCKANTQIAWCHSARFQGYHFSLRQSLTVLWAKNWENSFSDAVAQCLSQCHSEGVSRTEDTRGFDRRCTSVLSIGPSPCPSMWVILWQCWSPSTLGIIFFLTGKNLETKEFVRHRFKNHFLQHLLYSINHSGQTGFRIRDD